MSDDAKAPKARKGVEATSEEKPEQPKIGSRLEPDEDALVKRFLPLVPTADGKPLTRSALLRAVLMPALSQMRRILDMPMPPGTTLRARMERVIEKGLEP